MDAQHLRAFNKILFNVHVINRLRGTGTRENRGREGDGSREVGVALRADWGAREKCKISKMLPSFINSFEYYQTLSSDNIDNFFYTILQV